MQVMSSGPQTCRLKPLEGRAEGHPAVALAILTLTVCLGGPSSGPTPILRAGVDTKTGGSVGTYPGLLAPEAQPQQSPAPGPRPSSPPRWTPSFLQSVLLAQPSVPLVCSHESGIEGSSCLLGRLGPLLLSGLVERAVLKRQTGPVSV